MRIFSFIILFCLFSNAAPAQTVKEAHTEVQLISEAKTVVPGGTFWMALTMRMDEGWHVYWLNPGDSGLPPSIKWTLPEGWTAGPIQWPTPERIDAPPLAAYGYEKEVVFLVPIQTSAQTPIDSSVELQANVSWLTCRVDCIPGKGEFKQTVSLSPFGEKDSQRAQMFAQARALLPKPQSSWNVKVYSTKDGWQMRFSGALPPKSAQFFPERSDVILHAAEQRLRSDTSGFTLEIPKSNLLNQKPASLAGILKTDQTAFLIQAPVLLAEPSSTEKTIPFALVCLFALLGGLILNIMPCVLPILSIKILSLAANQYSRRESIKQGLFFALGVLLSFWLLTCILLLIQDAGVKVGWGFQFQSAWFVGVMAVIFLVFAFNLFGFFEIGTQLAGLGAFLRSAKGVKASFLNGFLATVVATPCTAPFMGTAIAYALTQSTWEAFAVFSFLGLGMALPMVILSAFPSALRFLPKPGPWMNTLKKVLGVMMLLSAFWMIWVLTLQLNNPSKVVVEDNQGWQEYSPELIKKLQKEGKDYFLDFTAAWCLTCQVNDRRVLNNPKVLEKFKEMNIILVKADWTRYNPVVTKALSDYGRNSIPLYVYYSSRRGKEDILGESITVQGLIQILLTSSNK